MSVVSSKSLDMTSGIIWRKIFSFAIPIILGDILQQLYGTVDSIVVGHYIGRTALAAVGATETVISTALAILVGISQGATIAISQAFGARDRQGVKKYVHTTVAISILLAAVLTVLGLFGIPLMLRLLSTPDDVYIEARQYLVVYFCGIICPILYNLLSGILRAVGDAKRPLYSLILCSCLNILLDLFFVAVLDWGIIGAAAATVIAQSLSAFYLLLLLVKTDEGYKIQFKCIGLDGKSFNKIMSLGLPIGLQRTLVAFSNTLVVSRINTFGSGAMAAWGVYRRLDQAVMNFSQSFSVAIATFVGQNYGANKIDRMNKGYRTALSMVIALTVFFSGLVIGLRHPLIRLFSQDNEVVQYGCTILICAMSLQWLHCINQCRGGFLRGIGDSKGPMLIMMISFILLRQLFLYVGWPHFASVGFATISYPFGWLCASLIMEIYTRIKYSGKYQKTEILNSIE